MIWISFGWLYWANLAAFVMLDVAVTWLIFALYGGQRPTNRTLIPSLRWAVSAGGTANSSIPGWVRLTIHGLVVARLTIAAAFVMVFILVYGYERGLYFLELLDLRLNAYG